MPGQKKRVKHQERIVLLEPARKHEAWRVKPMGSRAAQAGARSVPADILELDVLQRQRL